MLYPQKKAVLSLIIFSRVILMLTFQGITFLILIRTDDAFNQSATYWTLYLTLTNVILLALMFKFNNHIGYTQSFKFEKTHAVSFLKWLPVLLIVAMVPNLLLAYVIYGDLEIGAKLLLFNQGFLMMLFNLSLFPILQGLTEIPFYFLVLKPAIKHHTTKPILYLGIPILMLSLQHSVMPFYLDWSYVLYRGFMFLGFALFIGIMIDKKPGYMPYFIIIHILMNLSFMMMQFM